MSRKRHYDNKGRIEGPFVPMLVDTMKWPAWRALSHGARSLFLALKSKYGSKLHNNGRLFLSMREAAKELGSNKDSVRKWYFELQHYGFIVQTTPGCLGVDGRGKAPHWRLTELGYMKELPTRDFERWDGTPFEPPPPKKRQSKKQNPVRRIRTVCPKEPDSGVRKTRTLSSPTVPKSGDIGEPARRPKNQDISRLTIFPPAEPRPGDTEAA
jgi:hypothetical protein